MSTLEEQLARKEWEPAPGDKLIGTITEIKAREAKNGNLYPVLIVRDAEGTEHIVSCALMASDVIAARPVPGDRVGIRFDGPQPKSSGDGTWDRYIIAFEQEKPAEIDWNRMATSRNLPAPHAVNGQSAAQPAARVGNDPWQSQPADSGFSDEVPF